VKALLNIRAGRLVVGNTQLPARWLVCTAGLLGEEPGQGDGPGYFCCVVNCMYIIGQVQYGDFSGCKAAQCVLTDFVPYHHAVGAVIAPLLCVCLCIRPQEKLHVCFACGEVLHPARSITA
jgi:hypothetical protein